MEEAFTSVSHVGRELLGFSELVREVGFMVAEPMPMMMDKQAAMRQLKSEHHDKLKTSRHTD